MLHFGDSNRFSTGIYPNSSPSAKRRSRRKPTGTASDIYQTFNVL